MPTSTTLDQLNDDTRPDAAPRPRPPARRITIWAAATAATVWVLLLIGGVLAEDDGGLWLHVAINVWAVSWVIAGIDWVSHHNTLAAIRIVRADLDAHTQQAATTAADLAAMREQMTALAGQVAALSAALGEYGDGRFLAGSQAAIDALTPPASGADVLPIGGRIPSPRNGFATPTGPRCTSGAPTATDKLL